MNHVSPQGGSISRLYPTCYNTKVYTGGIYISDIHLQVLYTPTSFLQEVYMKFIHLLLSNLIGQNVQAMVQVTVMFYHKDDSKTVRGKGVGELTGKKKAEVSTECHPHIRHFLLHIQMYL